MLMLIELLTLAALLAILSGTGYVAARATDVALSMALCCVLGAAALTCWGTICFYLSIPLGVAAALPALALILSACRREFWRLWRGYQLPCLLAVYLLFKLVVFRGEAFTFRLHSSPDAYGIGSTFGLMQTDFSYSAMLARFYELTGLTEPRWVKPPKLLDVWSIPDAQLRFASDQIIGSGRVGISALLAILDVFIPAQFYALFMLFGLLGLWAQACISFQLAQVASAGAMGRVAGVALALVIPTTFVSQIYLLEGLSVAAWQQVLLLLIYLLWVDQLRESRRGTLWLTLLLVAAVYASYPDSLILLSLLVAGTLGLGLAALAVGRVMPSKHVVCATLPLIAGPLTALLLDPRMRAQMVSRLADVNAATNAGGSIHLGLPTYHGLLGAVPDSVAMRFTDLGFAPLSQDWKSAATSVVLVALILLLGAYRARRTGMIFAYIPALVCAALPLHFLARVSSGVIISDYVYFRSLSTFVVLSIPLVTAALWMKGRGRWSAVAVVASACWISWSAVHTSARAFVQSSRYSPSACWRGIDYDRAIFVSGKPDRVVHALTACGPLYYITDNWAPHMKADGQAYQVYKLDLDDVAITKHRIGEVHLTSDLIGPCDVDCIARRLAP